MCSWTKTLALLGMLLGIALPAGAGTTGTVAGRITDQYGAPVISAIVIVPGGGMVTSNQNGYYSVLNVPPGRYEVRFTRVGYGAKNITEVDVSADLSTKLDVVLELSPISIEAVTTVAERPLVDVNVTSSRAVLSERDIDLLPVQELSDLVDLQAGVVEGHFRGGRIGEVQYQVDGVSVNNSYDNKSILTLDRSLLKEVQVISGTFDAEYGQAMSGVVNAVLKTGTDQFEWGAEAYTGAHVFPGRDSRLVADEVHPTGIQSYQLSLSGPIAVLGPSTTYLLSGRVHETGSYVRADRRFRPTDSSDFERNVFRPTGDGKESSLGYTEGWSGVGKMTSALFKNVRVSYQAILERTKARKDEYEFRYNPDGLSTQRTTAFSHGLDWSQTLSQSSYLSLSFRQNLFDYSDYVYEDVFDPRYDAAGPTLSDPSYELNAVLQGVQFTRFEQRTNSLIGKANWVGQVTPEHQVKAGIEADLPQIRFGTPGHLNYVILNGVETLVRHVDDPPDFPGVRKYHPVIAAAYLQDQIEWSDLLIRAGTRFDYFDARSTVPSDLGNPANIINGAPESHPRDTSVKSAFSPRLGVSYPILDRAAVHFAYGHFRQFPAIGEIFRNADYGVLTNLQAGSTQFGNVLGNPDVSPEHTVQYEMGYKHALSEDLAGDFTVFYKNVRNLLGVEFISTYNDAEYARLTNVDFGDVLGFTFAVDHRAFGPASISLDYTWQRALGNASDPRETATRAEAGEDPRPRLVPFNWDQRHTLNLTAAITSPGSYTASAILRVASGQPYTPVIESGFGQGLDTNSGRKPAGVLLDLRGERAAGTWFGTHVNFFGRVLNVLDTRYFNGSVFASTGSPYYSRFPEPDKTTLANPTRFHPPRRIEIGLRLGSEPS